MTIFMLVILSGIILGVAAGLMPGISVSITVIALYPILVNLDAPMVFLFYAALCCTMQYYGSISSIVFGVIGEPTSSPAVENGHELFRQGLGNEILAATATSSFIAGVFGIAVFWLCVTYTDVILSLLTAKVKVSILFIVLLVLIWTSKHKSVGLLLIIAGLTVGSVGSTIITWVYYIFPRYGITDGGIPFSPLITGFIAIPALLHYMRNPCSLSHPNVKLTTIRAKQRFALLFKLDHLTSTLRGSLIGCITGIVPGVSYVISSNVAEAIEKVLNRKQSDPESLSKNVISAEAANNAGMMIVLIPLLLFAIPIVPSEAIILSIAESHGFSYITGTKFLHSYIWSIVGILLGVNVINWLVSGYCYKYMSDLFVYFNKYGYLVSLIGLLCLTLFTGYADNQFLLSIITLGIATIAGLLLVDLNTKLCFIFAYFISPELLPEMYRFYLLA